MSAKGGSSDSDNVPVEPEQVATSEEAVPVPYLAGTREIALRFITQPIGVFAVQAQTDGKGK